MIPPGRPRPSGRSLGLLILGGASLLAGLTGALVLLGVPMPAATGRLGASHGLLMTLGFLGTLIALERAVALGRAWGYLAPIAAGLGGVAALVGQPFQVAGALMTVAGIVYLGMYVAFDRVERALHTSVQALGAAAWTGAALLVLTGRPTSAIVPWLAAFLVLTIAGERLELSRVRHLTPGARRAFMAAATLFSGGVVLTLVALDAGWRLGGVGLVALAAWLGSLDVARRTVRVPGVTRFVAVALLAGYLWLAVAGACWVVFGSDPAMAAYDTMIHALFLGFVMSMVFGHAPVILPAVLRLPLPYGPHFYLHLVLLHAGLLMRVVGGDLLGSEVAWRWGGIVNVVAVLLFVLVSAATAIRAWYGGARRSGMAAATHERRRPMPDDRQLDGREIAPARRHERTGGGAAS